MLYATRRPFCQSACAPVVRFHELRSALAIALATIAQSDVVLRSRRAGGSERLRGEYI